MKLHNQTEACEPAAGSDRRTSQTVILKWKGWLHKSRYLSEEKQKNTRRPHPLASDLPFPSGRRGGRHNGSEFAPSSDFVQPTSLAAAYCTVRRCSRIGPDQTLLLRHARCTCERTCMQTAQRSAHTIVKHAPLGKKLLLTTVALDLSCAWQKQMEVSKPPRGRPHVRVLLAGRWIPLSKALLEDGPACGAMLAEVGAREHSELLACATRLQHPQLLRLESEAKKAAAKWEAAQWAAALRQAACAALKE